MTAALLTIAHLGKIYLDSNKPKREAGGRLDYFLGKLSGKNNAGSG